MTPDAANPRAFHTETNMRDHNNNSANNCEFQSPATPLSATPGNHGTPPCSNPSPSCDQPTHPPSSNLQPKALQGPISPSTDQATPTAPCSASGPIKPPGTKTSPSSLSISTPSSTRPDHSPSSDPGPETSPGRLPSAIQSSNPVVPHRPHPFRPRRSPPH